MLQRTIIASQGPGSILEQAVGGDWKGKASPLLYVAGMVAARRAPHVAQAVYCLVALLWLVPDRRIERVLARHREREEGGVAAR